VSEFYVLMFRNTLSVLSYTTYEDGSVLICWHIKFIHLGITQKKEYSIQNMAKV